MGCGCGSSGNTRYERVWRWTRTGQAPVESADRNHLETLRTTAGGHGRIERRVRVAK